MKFIVVLNLLFGPLFTQGKGKSLDSLLIWVGLDGRKWEWAELA